MYICVYKPHQISKSKYKVNKSDFLLKFNFLFKHFWKEGASYQTANENPN